MKGEQREQVESMAPCSGGDDLCHIVRGRRVGLRTSGTKKSVA